MRVLAAALAALLAVAVLARSAAASSACAASAAERACTSNAQCVFGYCVGGTCTAPTYGAAGAVCNYAVGQLCMNGLICLDPYSPNVTSSGVCTKPSLRTPCRDNSFCTCIAGFCDFLRTPGDFCRVDEQCSSGVCSNGKCAGVAPGRACSWTAARPYNPCTPLYVCLEGTAGSKTGTCLASLAKGRNCDAAFYASPLGSREDVCEPGMACNIGLASPVCQELYSLPADSPCTPPSNVTAGSLCQLGLSCMQIAGGSSYTCQRPTVPSQCSSYATPVTTGEATVLTDTCPQGYSCACDASSGLSTCQQSAATPSTCQPLLNSLVTCLQNTTQQCPTSNYDFEHPYAFTEPGTCLYNCADAYRNYSCCAENQYTLLNDFSPPGSAPCQQCRFQCYHQGLCDYQSLSCACSAGFAGIDCADKVAVLAVVYTGFLLLLVIGLILVAIRVAKNK